jgi:hypothetical protein
MSSAVLKGFKMSKSSIVSPAGLRAAANGKREFTLKFHVAFLDRIVSKDCAQVGYGALPGVVSEFNGPNAVADAQDFIYDHNIEFSKVDGAQLLSYFNAFDASVQS